VGNESKDIGPVTASSLGPVMFLRAGLRRFDRAAIAKSAIILQILNASHDAREGEYETHRIKDHECPPNRNGRNVSAHEKLPIGGHQTCPLVVTKSAHWWP
jgi:hypothetical protein